MIICILISNQKKKKKKGHVKYIHIKISLKQSL